MKIHLLVFFFICSFSSFDILFAQSDNSTISQGSTIEILGQAIESDSLWNHTNLDRNEITKVFLLNHGTQQNLPDVFKINNLNIEIIEKNQIPMMLIQQAYLWSKSRWSPY